MKRPLYKADRSHCWPQPMTILTGSKNDLGVWSVKKMRPVSVKKILLSEVRDQ